MWRRKGWRGVRSSDPRAPDVGFCCLVLFCFALFCSCEISFDRLRYFPWVLSLVCFSFLLCVAFLAEGGTRVPPLSPPFGATSSGVGPAIASASSGIGSVGPVSNKNTYVPYSNPHNRLFIEDDSFVSLRDSFRCDSFRRGLFRFVSLTYIMISISKN